MKFRIKIIWRNLTPNLDSTDTYRLALEAYKGDALSNLLKDIVYMLGLKDTERLSEDQLLKLINDLPEDAMGL